MIQREGFCYLTVDFQRPRIGFHAARIGGRIGLIQTKFVEVVIAGNFIFRRKRQFILPFGRFRKGERGTGRGFRTIVAFKPVEQIGMSRRSKGQRSGANAKHFQDLAAL